MIKGRTDFKRNNKIGCRNFKEISSSVQNRKPEGKG